MTRHRTATTQRQRDAALRFQAPSQLTDEDRQALDCFAPSKPRKQHEAKEQAALSKWAMSQWWHRGYTHHDQATESWATARNRHRAGVRGGWPDVTVMVPGRVFYFVDKDQESESGLIAAKPAREPYAYCQLALELKRPDIRPKRRSGLWWLAWARELEADESWHAQKSEPKRHGLTARQALQLAYMQECGWQTFVAYGWDEARAWLEGQIGPRPDLRETARDLDFKNRFV